ncbi:SPJ_0845 family protein [Streptococcus didelphis]|uniref:SPJ_0845 family protein n=1 Tax=Streptococcus didelphis TaxID=102886 RepID=A0ABY9LI03_9STRE|nr:SPJ_0845 family protein [Streptococcus didelphis]WMB28463.1 SPJ_0845 family protein [Streptococcus didelphis]WMB29139.1 SPJ_0845 family protein [Streptococcus didelphis]
MAITHKKNDDLEKMMAGFASIPSFDKPIDVDAEGKIMTPLDDTMKSKPKEKHDE